ncbi:MAG: hypothetical protein AAF152_09415 [Cyanobacteria bacterium P01_A01_bin.114]
MVYFSNLTLHKKSARLALAGLLLTATVASAACSPGPQDTTTPAESNNVTQEELTEETDSLIGQLVTIRGEASEVVDDTSFLMAEDQLFGGEDILIINASGQPLVLPDVGDSQVQVTGEVEQFILADVESAYGLDLDPELYADYEEQPAVIAQSVALAPDPGEITAEPEKYYNQLIAVEGEVEEVLAADVFTLDEDELFGGDDLLVIGNKTTLDVQDEGIVTVTGVLRPYVAAEFEREYNPKWEISLQEKIEVEYTEKPVFVADDVYPSAVE